MVSPDGTSVYVTAQKYGRAGPGVDADLTTPVGDDQLGVDSPAFDAITSDLMV